jgi:uncharacterized protein involved in type VI secretion and phage assembly
MSADAAIVEVLERIRGRFFGKYRGSVADVDVTRGRITAYVPAVLASTKTGWCDPCVPYAGNQVGVAFMPEVGSGVWIEFEGGDVSYPIWSGCYWRDVTASGENQGAEMPSAVSAASSKVIQTKSGHQIVLDDADGSASIKITDSNGNSITLDSNGVAIKDCNGNSVMLDSTGVTVSDSSGNSIALDSTGVTISDFSSNTVALAASGVTINDPAFQVTQ